MLLDIWILMKTDVKGMLRNCSTNNIMVPIYPEKKNIYVQLDFRLDFCLFIFLNPF